MLRAPQYTTEQRVFMVDRRTRGDSIKAINYDFKKSFPFSGRNPDRQAIERNKQKFNKEGIMFITLYIYKENYIILISFIKYL